MSINSYNPKVKIGNWYEERAVGETAGVYRVNQNADEPGATGKRVISATAGESHDWQSTTARTYSYTRAGIKDPTALQPAAVPDRHDLPEQTVRNLDTVTTRALPRRRQEVESKALQSAIAARAQQQQEEAEKRAHEQRQHTYGHRAPVSRKREMEFAGAGAAGSQFPLHGPAVTIYTEQLTTLKGSTAFHGLSSVKSAFNPFGKNNSFTKPVDEGRGSLPDNL